MFLGSQGLQESCLGESGVSLKWYLSDVSLQWCHVKNVWWEQASSLNWHPEIFWGGCYDDEPNLVSLAQKIEPVSERGEGIALHFMPKRHNKVMKTPCVPPSFRVLKTAFSMFHLPPVQKF
jgi:hypothetical protein